MLTCSSLSSWVSYYGYTQGLIPYSNCELCSIQRCYSCVCIFVVELVVHAQHLLETSVTRTQPCHTAIQLTSLAWSDPTQVRSGHVRLPTDTHSIDLSGSKVIMHAAIELESSSLLPCRWYSAKVALTHC